MSEMTIRATGIAWFRQEDYHRCRKLFVDGRGLPETYEKWLKAAQGLFDKLTAEGHIVERAYIDPETFPAWCAARGLEIDSRARLQFANEVVYRKYADQS